MAQDWFDRASVAIGVLLLSTIFCVGVLQIVNRYVGLPIDAFWTYEVARTFLAFLTLAGLPYLFKNNSDISFLPVLQRITERTNAFLLLRNAIMLVFSVVMVWSAYLAYATTGDVGLPLLSWFKVGWGYLFLGLSFGVLFLYTIQDTRVRINTLRGESDV